MFANQITHVSFFVLINELSTHNKLELSYFSSSNVLDFFVPAPGCVEENNAAIRKGSLTKETACIKFATSISSKQLSACFKMTTFALSIHGWVLHQAAYQSIGQTSCWTLEVLKAFFSIFDLGAGSFVSLRSSVWVRQRLPFVLNVFF